MSAPHVTFRAPHEHIISPTRPAMPRSRVFTNSVLPRADRGLACNFCSRVFRNPRLPPPVAHLHSPVPISNRSRTNTAQEPFVMENRHWSCQPTRWGDGSGIAAFAAFATLPNTERRLEAGARKTDQAGIVDRGDSPTKKDRPGRGSPGIIRQPRSFNAASRPEPRLAPRPARRKPLRSRVPSLQGPLAATSTPPPCGVILCDRKVLSIKFGRIPTASRKIFRSLFRSIGRRNPFGFYALRGLGRATRLANF
jgi:hypothetical protein